MFRSLARLSTRGLVVAITLLFSCLARAANPINGGSQADAKPIQKPRPILELNAAEWELIAQAKAFAAAGKKQEALKAVEQFHERQGETAIYLELKANVLTLVKDYPGAEAAFAELLSKEPTSLIARFNRAETIMLQGRYAAAEREFSIVEKDQAAIDPSVADLARFKRIACLLAQNDRLAASTLVPPAQESRESPALYYSRAALAWNRKDIENANRLLAEARTQFNSNVDDLYTDTFVELGWGLRAADGQFAFKLKFR